MTTFNNPDDDPRIWGGDPEWDARMEQYQAELAEERRQRQEAHQREDVIGHTIEEVLQEAGPPIDTETMRRRLRQAFGLIP